MSRTVVFAAFNICIQVRGFLCYTPRRQWGSAGSWFPRLLLRSLLVPFPQLLVRNSIANNLDWRVDASFRWKPVDAARNWPDMGPNFQNNTDYEDNLEDRRDLDWSTVLKRTFEAYIRGEIPNMYGQYVVW
jgi:hypothetical protein